MGETKTFSNFIVYTEEKKVDHFLIPSVEVDSGWLKN